VRAAVSFYPTLLGLCVNDIQSPSKSHLYRTGIAEAPTAASSVGDRQEKAVCMVLALPALPDIISTKHRNIGRIISVLRPRH